MATVVCFGEIMLRLNPEGYLRLNQAQHLMVLLCGRRGECGRIVGELRRDCEVHQCGSRQQIGRKCPQFTKAVWCRYPPTCTWVGNGWGSTSSKRVRANVHRRSSMIGRTLRSLQADPARFDWDSIFEGASWFHWTGITPALSQQMVDATRTACEVAKKKGLTISCDLNYRKKLWSTEEARKTMETLVPYVDVLISNEEDAHDIFRHRG